MMRRGAGAPGKEGEKVMGPLFPRLHVNDSTLKGGGPRAPPRNKMALYEQFSVPASTHRPFSASANANANATASSAGQIGGSDRPLFPSFCVPSNEPVRSSDHMNTISNGRDGSAARAESGRISTQLRCKDTYLAGSTAECSSQRRENNTKSSTGKKLTNDDDFMVPSVFCAGGVPPHSAREEVRIQDKSTPFATTSPYKSGPTASKSSAKYSNTDKRYLEGMNVSDTRSRDSPSIRDKAPPAKATTNSEAGARTSSFQFFSTEKTGKTDDRASSYREKLSSINVSDKQHSQADGRQTGRRNENTAESQNVPGTGDGPYSTDIGCNGASNMSERGLRESGAKRKRSTGHQEVQKDDSSDSSVDSLPGLEICPEDVVGAIGPKHFWKARRAIVNQQRVFAVQVFELHRLIKVQKLIAASPHLLIEGDPCLGTALVTSKKKLAAANVEKQILSAKSKDDDDAQLTLQQAEYSKEDYTEGNQASPSQDDDIVEVQHNNIQAASTGAVSSNPPASMPAPPDNMPAPPDNDKQNNNWCAPPPPNQWLVPVMSPSEGLVYKPYAGPCPPAGSFLAPFYAGCAPLSLPSTAGDCMASPYGMPMPHHHHQPQHMGVVGGPPPMPPMYFPPFTMPVMNNPVVSASAVEQASRGIAPARPVAEHLSRTSCNMRNEAMSGGVWRFHSSAARDSELQGSSAASSPFDRQQQLQGEARAAPPPPPPPIPASSAGNNNNGGGQQQQPQPSGGSKETPAARVIRVVPHTARTASESAARIFRSIQMERQQNDP